MATEKIYERDVYRTEQTAAITSLEPVENGFLLTLDKTIFAPSGGGQDRDKGYINAFHITDIYEKDGEIYHKVAVKKGLWFPKTGETANLLLDWNTRFSNMQRHTGEHILSGAFYELYKGVNKGFHMGDDYMTIDIDSEEPVTWDMALRAESYSNKVIWENLPVTTLNIDKREDAKDIPLRKALTLLEDIKIVCVGNPANPADCVACCGTHVAFTGEVGIIKVYKAEKNKDLYRIYFDAGRRAYEKLTVIYEQAQSLGVHYSTQPENIFDRILAREEKEQAVRNRLYNLTQSIIKERQKEIESSMASGTNVFTYNDLPLNDLVKIGNGLTSVIPLVLVIIQEEEKAALLFSDGKKADCNKLVKDTAPVFNGKGGGNKESARAFFTTLDNLMTFVDALNKHLR